ncbi:MAG: response regulator [Eubacterium sp.]|nr:response regulator [Eubacterium sp.]
MKIIAVEDEYLALEGILSGLNKVVPDAEITGFQDPIEVYDTIDDISADVAFLDIEMRTVNGIELAKKLRESHPYINIVFTTGYKEYMEDAFDLHVSGYIVKPITPDKIKTELENLRFPVREQKRKLRLQTFGEFEAFAGDAPIVFTYAKTKELLAYLVDSNGAMVTNSTLVAALWEDDEDGASSHTSYLRNLISDLTNTLKDNGISDAVIRRRGMIGIDRSKVSCDYYDLLDGDENARRKANGEYMSQYSWAEITHGQVVQMLYP